MSQPTAAANRTLRPAGFTVTVPGTWVDVPLESDEALRRSVSAIVKRRVGTDDRLARMRADAREQLGDAARRARAAGAVAFAMSLELAPGVPFPASLVVERREWADPAVDGESVAARLAREFPHAEIVEGVGPRPFARHRRYEQRTFGEESTTRAELEYEIPHPDSGLLRCVFSVEMIDRSEVFIDLFDVIIGTVRFPDPAAHES